MTKAQVLTDNRKRKKKASKNALKEIRNEQKRTNLIIPSAPMQRVISEIAGNFKPNLRFKKDAYIAIHTAVEDMLIDLLEKANACAVSEQRETIQPKDMYLAQKLSK
jgi:histone H3